MARPLTVGPPTAQQLRRLHRFLETPLVSWQRRRAEVLLLLAAGHPAQFIADLLEVHVNTIYADLHAFARHGLRCLEPVRQRGAPPRLTRAQVKTIWGLAEQSPLRLVAVHSVRRLTRAQVKTIWGLAEQSPLRLGLPFARWSLAKLRAYLLCHRIVKAISREHLRRVLKKGGTVCGASVASC